MRFLLSSVPGCAALALMALACPDGALAQAGPAGDKIQFSEPSNPTIASNLNGLNPRENGFKQVEQDLFKPFRLSLPQNSPDGMMRFPPPQTAPTPDKHTLEMIERRKNWAFTDWNDLFPGAPTDDLSDTGPDGREKKPVSLIERYFESANQKPTATNRWNAATWFNHDRFATNDFDPRGESFSVDGQFRKLMRQIVNPRGTDEADRDVIDFKRADFRQFSAEEIQEQKRRHEQFEQLLDPHWAAAHPDPDQAAANPATNLFNSASAHQSLNGPAPGAADATARAFYSHAYDDPTAVALGQTNNLLTPKPTVPLLPPPTLTPFDNLPKRKF